MDAYQVLKNGSVQKLLKGQFGYQKVKEAATDTKDATYESAKSETGEVAISGVGVVF